MQRNTIDARMERFVEACGTVPLEARRLLDDEARAHGAPWIQRLIGKGIACDYVIGYAHNQSWWTFCFDRRPEFEGRGEHSEVWRVEAYDSLGRAWSDLFSYSRDSDEWLLLVVDPKNARHSKPHRPGLTVGTA